MGFSSGLEAVNDRVVSFGQFRRSAVCQPAPFIISRACCGHDEQRGVPPDYLAGRNVAEQFRDVLDCFSGDLGLVGPGIFESNAALGAFLDEIAVKRGVAIKLSSGGSDD